MRLPVVLLVLSLIVSPDSQAVASSTALTNETVTRAIKTWERQQLQTCPNLHVTYIGRPYQGWVRSSSNCGKPDVSDNEFLHFALGRWSVACSHGDDVMDVSSAARKCSMPPAVARKLGLR